MNQLTNLQQKAAQYLMIDPAALQIALLLQLNACRLHQSLLSAANTCGCITLGTAKANLPADADWQTLQTQPTGDNFADICPNCRSLLTEHLGALLFYAAALANALNLDLDTICDHETEKLDMLGYFMLM